MDGVNIRTAFARCIAVVTSVWMPLVALPLLMLGVDVENALFAKCPIFMVRYSLGGHWVSLGFWLIAFVALASLVCDVARSRWWRAVGRVALFVAGWAAMLFVGFHVDGGARRLRPTLEVHVIDSDVARIEGEEFRGDELYAILRRVNRRCRVGIAFVVEKDIGCCDFTENFLNKASAAGVWQCAFRTEDGDLNFVYEEVEHYFMHSPMSGRRIAAVCIGEGGRFTYEANIQRMAEYLEETPGDGKDASDFAFFKDGEEDVFGDGKAEECAAAIVVVASNDAPISAAVACVRRFIEAGYKMVFINRLLM